MNTSPAASCGQTREIHDVRTAERMAEHDKRRPLACRRQERMKIVCLASALNLSVRGSLRITPARLHAHIRVAVAMHPGLR
jgi:hypothetical protein